MFEIGDKVVYGQTGVCLITDICQKAFIKNQKREYYVLKPLGLDNNVIFAPKQGGKIFMRHVITKAQAEGVIDAIPAIIEKLSDGGEFSKEEYTEKLNRHTLEDLVELTSVIYSKKLNAGRLNKRLNTIDEKYMKIGENLLFGELAEALGIPFDKVQGYIEKRIGK